MSDGTTAAAQPNPLVGYSAHDVTPEQALALFEDARDRCPVAHSEKLGGFHMLLDYVDVKRAMADTTTFSSCPSVLRPLFDHPAFPPLEMDGEEHPEWR